MCVLDQFVVLTATYTELKPASLLGLLGKVKAKFGRKTKEMSSNVCNDALHVIGLHETGDKISLFLQDWEVAEVALSCQMALEHAVPGNAMRPGGSFVAARRASVSQKEEGT